MIDTVSVLSMLSVPSFTSVDRQRGFMVGWFYVGRGTGIVMSRMTATTKAVIARQPGDPVFQRRAGGR
ncbi:hypothetical protein XH84_20040 [Bradyrhizobium nanningense]|nr:hypothetical protein XH84_20040 [Bradyrhizobium nanningense]